MATGLSVQDVVAVSISLSAPPAGFRNFGACFVIGPSDVIDIVERKRQYSGIEGIASDFGTTAPEYLWAEEFFAQDPPPNLLYVGRWAQTATHALLHGASLTPAQRLMSAFTAVTNGGFRISVDGSLRSLVGLDFSGTTNLNGVASVIQAALVAAGSTGATVTWDAVNYRFNVRSGTAGTSSSLSYATAPAAGADVSVLLGLSITPNATGANADPPIPGIAAETALGCIEAMGDMFGDWYAVDFALATPMADSDRIAVSGYIQAASQARISALTTENTVAYDDTRTDDIGSILDSLEYDRTLTHFSSNNPYAAASIFGRIATIDYLGSNTTITLKFKQMPGVVPELLTETQAATLKSKNYNTFVRYQNGTSILQEGVMANGTFIDSRINADWLANFVQTNVYNVLFEMPKVPQTDEGMNLLKAAMTQSLQQAVVNGYLAPGQWNGPSFGTLRTGDNLPLGFYIYAPLVASQNETDRAKRKSVPFQIAAKEAGAVHSANIMITVNP